MSTVHPICQALREARQEAGLSMTALADKMGCSQAMICHMERGQRLPRLLMLDRWTKALGYELELSPSLNGGGS